MAGREVSRLRRFPSDYSRADLRPDDRPERQLWPGTLGVGAAALARARRSVTLWLSGTPLNVMSLMGHVIEEGAAVGDAVITSCAVPETYCITGEGDRSLMVSRGLRERFLTVAPLCRVWSFVGGESFVGSDRGRCGGDGEGWR